MCGIAGMFSLGGAPVEDSVLAAMDAAMVHRGPDDEGRFCDGVAALGMRRLSIIGVSNGRQPIFNEDRSVAVVMNGEIYNYAQLKADLERRGHHFATLSDVEVAVHLYEEHGADFVDAMRGMFAFALYDQRRRRLLLGRDRPGKKPLYYAVHEGRLWFASEIKALHATHRLPTAIDRDGLVAYLANGFVVGQRTLFEGIQKLPAAHLLEVNGGAVSVRRYWDVPRPVPFEPSLATAAANVRSLLREAVRSRLMSEVPLGAFLSGGVDSSAVVALMSEALERPVETFAVGFGDAEFDELGFARAAADLYKTNHHELQVKDCDAALLGEINRFNDEPAADPAAVPTYCLSRFARQHVTVVLTGEGGDELFAGYRHHHLQARLEQLDNLPGAARLAHSLARLESIAAGRGLRRLWKGLWIAGLPAIDRPRGLVSVLTDDGLCGLLRRELWPADGSTYHTQSFRALAATVANLDAVSQSLYVDAQSQLPEQLLMKVDKMTMAASLEARCPFLDQALVEYAASLPVRLKRVGGAGKRVLRQALRGLVPDALLDRPKHGFEVPIRRWLMGSLSALVGDLLLANQAPLHDYLEPAPIRAMWQKLHAAPDQQLARQLWLLLNLAVWQSQHWSAASQCEGHGERGQA